MKEQTIIESKGFPKIIINENLFQKRFFSNIFLPLTRIFNKERILKVSLPRFKHPIYMRAQTSDVLNTEEIFVNGDYDFKFPEKITKIIDAGANVGFASIYFYKIFKNTKILAVEPEKSNFSLLKRNTGPYKDIKILNRALWTKEANLKISNRGKTDNWGFMVEEVKGDVDCEVRGISIESCMRIMGWDKIDLLKLDIEGSEKELFSEGYERWISKVKVIILELHEKMRAGATESFYNAIKSYNFKEIKIRGKYAKHMRFLVNKDYAK